MVAPLADGDRVEAAKAMLDRNITLNGSTCPACTNGDAARLEIAEKWLRLPAADGGERVYIPLECPYCGYSVLFALEAVEGA